MKWIFVLIIVIIIVLYGRRSSESFTAPLMEEAEKPVLTYPPNGPSPVDQTSNAPFHLLDDVFAMGAAHGPVGAAACYETDYEQQHARTGNFRQSTNNYRHSYPDSCSATRLDTVLQFYKK